MALGDVKLMRELPLRAGKEEIDNDNDTIQLIFASDTYASIDVNNTTVNNTIFTGVSGGNVAASYNLVTTWSRVGGATALDADDIGTIAKDPSNPATIRTAIMYNSTADVTYAVYDMTNDGSTPLDWVNNDITATFTGVAYTATV